MSLRVLAFEIDDRWLPKSVICLRDYSSNKFLHDVVAGVTVGLVALPLAMAFSIASGLTPQAGIYCAIVTGFLIPRWADPRPKLAGRPALSSWSSRESWPSMESMACSCAPSWPEFYS